MQGIQEAFQESCAQALQSTAKQREKLVALASQYTPDILLGAFDLCLQEAARETLVFKLEKNQETGQEEVIYKRWPLHEFLENGRVLSYVERVIPYEATGWPLVFLARKRISPSEITPHHVNALKWLYDHKKHHEFELVFYEHHANVPFTALLSNAARYCQELVAKLHAEVLASRRPSAFQAKGESLARHKRRPVEEWQEYAPLAEHLNERIHSLHTV